MGQTTTTWSKCNKYVLWIYRTFTFQERRHDIVEAFSEDSVLRSTLQEDFLKGIPDLDRIIRKFQRLRASLKDCVMLYQFTTRLEQLQKALEDYDGQHKGLIQEYITLVEVCVFSAFSLYTTATSKWLF